VLVIALPVGLVPVWSFEGSVLLWLEIPALLELEVLDVLEF